MKHFTGQTLWFSQSHPEFLCGISPRHRSDVECSWCLGGGIPLGGRGVPPWCHCEHPGSLSWVLTLLEAGERRHEDHRMENLSRHVSLPSSQAGKRGSGVILPVEAWGPEEGLISSHCSAKIVTVISSPEAEEVGRLLSARECCLTPIGSRLGI